MGRCVTEKNDLYTWCMENGDYGQQLLSEWVGKDEDDNDYDIKNVTAHKGKPKMLWKCSEGHEFYQTIGHRTYGRGCPYCSNANRSVNNMKAKLHSGENDLYSWCVLNNDYGQQLLQEWVGLDEHENSIDMHNIAKGSGLKVKWLCKKGHSWVASINSRTCIHHTGCPECKRETLSIKVHNAKTRDGENDLYSWCQSNGDFGQQLIAEWVGKDENNKDINMNDITFRNGLKVFWKCDRGHEWVARIADRTYSRSLCPKCITNSTSYPEQFIYWALKQIYPQTISRGKYQGIEFDITVPEEKTCIEYSPTGWHKHKKDRDELKNKICKEHNVNLINIVEDSKNELQETWENTYICFHMNQSKIDEYCIKLITFILKIFNHSIDEIDIQYTKKMAFDYSHGKVLDNNSLSYKFEDLLNDWDFDKNTFSPNEVTAFSNRKASWKCSKCNYEWTALISARTAQKQGCPNCGYSILENKYKSYGALSATDNNCLKSKYPLLDKEYSINNDKDSSKIKCGSSLKCEWVCTKCGYTWIATVNDRVRHKSGCPNCHYNWYKT